MVKIATIVQRLETSLQKGSNEGDWFDSIDLQGLIEAEDNIEEKIESVQQEIDSEEEEDGV